MIPVFINARFRWQVLVCFLAFAPALDAARMFEPLFRVVNISGPCYVRVADGADMEAAVNGRAYPFGTTVETLGGASAIVLVSGEDFITMRPHTRVRPVRTGPATRPRVEIHHEIGMISYSIRDRIGEENRLSILSPVAVTDQVAGRGDINIGRDSTLLLQNNKPRMGSQRIRGLHFEVPRLGRGHELQVAAALDRSYLRLINLGGDYPIITENPDDQPVTVNTTPRTTIKFWQQQAPLGGRLIVSVLASLPDGRQLQRYAFQARETQTIQPIRVEPLFRPEPQKRPWWRPFGRRPAAPPEALPSVEIEMGEGLEPVEEIAPGEPVDTPEIPENGFN